jgi:hypothetical protein
MGAAMVEDIKASVREILGDAPSELFLARVDRTLDEGMPYAMEDAAAKVVKMVRLFIDEQKAEELRRRCREILQGQASSAQ